MFTSFARSLKYIYIYVLQIKLTRMEARKVNQFGRSYRPGVALAQDLKFLIIDSIIRDGGDRITECYTICKGVACFCKHDKIGVV